VVRSLSETPPHVHLLPFPLSHVAPAPRPYFPSPASPPCPHAACDLIVRYQRPPAPPRTAPPLEEPLPEMVTCARGHTFCLPCGGQVRR